MSKKSSFVGTANDFVGNLSVGTINTMFRIAGTDYDRRRKVTKMQQRLMKKQKKLLRKK